VQIENAKLKSKKKIEYEALDETQVEMQ